MLEGAPISPIVRLTRPSSSYVDCPVNVSGNCVQVKIAAQLLDTRGSPSGHGLLVRLPFLKRYAFRHETEFRAILSFETTTAPPRAAVVAV